MTRVADDVFRLRIAPVFPTTKPDKLITMLEGYRAQGIRVTQTPTKKIKSDGSRVIVTQVHGTRAHLEGTVKRLVQAFGFRVVTDAEMDRAFLLEQEEERRQAEHLSRLPNSVTTIERKAAYRRVYGYRSPT